MSDDTISRQAAIDKGMWISDEIGDCYTTTYCPHCGSMHGRWLNVEPAPHDLWYATCSVCGDRQMIEVANYCPNCGARMDGEEE